jgi:hypothetical protein
MSLIPCAVLSSEVTVTVEGKVLAFDQTEVTIGAFEKFVRATGIETDA